MKHGRIGVLLLLAASSASAQEVPIVQPGAPGQKSARLTAEQAVKLADARYTVDDVVFMRDMIHHHDQAVQMAELVKDRTNLPELVVVAPPTSRARARSARCRPAAGRTRTRWCSRTRDRIVVYNSGTAGVRKEEELAGCIGDVPGDTRTALFRIDVVEIPKADPSKARITSSPAVFADEASGRLAGLWKGGTHGEGTQETSQTDQCHDITVFPTRKLAAGACSGNGIIFDISDPLNPRRLDAVTDKGFAYWHSATFNNDGTKVIFTDEWGGGTRPRCRSYDPRNWGADAIYDIVDNKLVYRGTYKLPASQTRDRGKG
jgi:hypothetical protein